MLPVILPIWEKLGRKNGRRWLPLGAGPMVVDYLQGKFLQDLERITTPILFLHSKKDQVTDHRYLEEYAGKIPSRKKEVKYFENGNHVLDRNPKLIVSQAEEFFDLPSNDGTKNAE